MRWFNLIQLEKEGKIILCKKCRGLRAGESPVTMPLCICAQKEYWDWRRRKNKNLEYKIFR